jgi:hypothetical protein
MSYIGNLDLTSYKIHGEWTSGHKSKNGRIVHNQIRHVSMNNIRGKNIQFWEMKTRLKDENEKTINFIFDTEIYNKYSEFTCTPIKRKNHYYLQITIK